MIPHERSLVSELKDKPFALIGVNSDPSLESYQEQAKAQQVTWRSFWSGPEGTAGPIPSRWGIRGWPSIFVIDHKGVIRFKNVRGEALEEAIHALIAEAEKDRGAGK